jgi:hypothetical protein
MVKRSLTIDRRPNLKIAGTQHELTFSALLAANAVESAPQTGTIILIE